MELADTLVDGVGADSALTRLVWVSVDLLAADAAGLLLEDSRQRLTTAATTHRDAERAQFQQLHTGEGPCVDCYRSGSPVAVTDITTSDRWPRLAAAMATGRPAFRSVHALPLRLRDRTIGTLNLFRAMAEPLSLADLALGQALADAAIVAVHNNRAVHEARTLADQLQNALTSRVVIEQAKGMIAHSHRVTMQTAFDHLRHYARNGNHRLVDVARHVVEGRLDPAALPESVSTATP